MCLSLDRWGEITEALRIRDVQLEEKARELLEKREDSDASKASERSSLNASLAGARG